MATTASTPSTRKISVAPAIKTAKAMPAKPPIKQKAADKKVVAKPHASSLLKPKGTEKQAPVKPVEKKKAAPKSMAPIKSKAGKTIEGKPTPKRPATRAAAKSQKRASTIAPEERHQMICDAAYFRAERRGFINGDPQQDWLEAEQEIEAMQL